MGRYGRRKKDGKTSGVCSGGPMATSSPENRDQSVQEQDDPEVLFDQYYQKYLEVKEKEFNAFIETIDPKILEMPFFFTLKFYDLLMEDGNNKEVEPKQSENPQNTTESEFKIPMSVPKQRKKGGRELNGHASTSRNVHWDLTAIEDDSVENNFKTPLRNKGIHRGGQSTSEPKTPSISCKEPFAVVTPGPMMKKNVRLFRLPEAGETAVSLSGSPLLVTPFGTNNGPQVTLTLPTDNGKVMTIRPPDRAVSDEDEVISQLDPNTKKQLKDLATYLLYNIDSTLSQ